MRILDRIFLSRKTVSNNKQASYKNIHWGQRLSLFAGGDLDFDNNWYLILRGSTGFTWHDDYYAHDYYVPTQKV